MDKRAPCALVLQLIAALFPSPSSIFISSSQLPNPSMFPTFSICLLLISAIGVSSQGDTGGTCNLQNAFSIG
ncbi:hypothetical protein B0H16DRAFT_1594506 [Mycena metata]|uniref:Uncharacterized protein n=1 Tax=Mycena metata TaxID=1033252 RepID=A0AAD7HQ65_9AGAR|nr:hypothetical protein B0H16DRAFT_1594506 [Mycena metata]